jgi:hypothetical protein
MTDSWREYRLGDLMDIKHGFAFSGDYFRDDPQGDILLTPGQVLGDETLKAIAREVVEAVRHNVTIDWTVKESVRAKLRILVKRILRKYGYPPDKQEKATRTVLEQAEVLCKEWAGD